ncbi:hypothetical protein QUF90_03660 [Desulfococcaceae bacterium HSG9]|nr:hypothetical protein [Desulfococcaceae bacterium HSG9]
MVSRSHGTGKTRYVTATKTARRTIGWRKVSVRPHRTKDDLAFEMEEFLRTRYTAVG